MEVFDGPQLRRPRVSLLSSADIVPMDVGDANRVNRWFSGFDLVLEGCEDYRVFAVCPAEDADPKEFTASGSVEPYSPYVLYATDHCSTFPAERQFYDRAQRKLEAGESTALEEQLWTGSVAGTTTNNPNLAESAVTIDFTADTVAEGFNIMEQALAECSAGQGMIHIRPALLQPLLDVKAIRREGNVYLSPLDNIVVPGRGYPGTGPAAEAVGATEWIYGHAGVVQVRRSPIVRLSEDNVKEQVQRATNDRLVIVERVVHVALDPTCCVYAVDVPSIGAVTIAA